MNEGEARLLAPRRTLDLNGCSPTRFPEGYGGVQPGQQLPARPGPFSEMEYRRDGRHARARFPASQGDIPRLQSGAVVL